MSTIDRMKNNENKNILFINHKKKCEIISDSLIIVSFFNYYKLDPKTWVTLFFKFIIFIILYMISLSLKVVFNKTYILELSWKQCGGF
jgi:hypothetical protein